MSAQKTQNELNGVGKMPFDEATAEQCIHKGKKVASLVINVFEGRVCEVLIRGDENEIREVIQENLARITSLLAA